MGIIIKGNTSTKLYSLKSSVSDESLHPDVKQVTEDEVKTILIQDKFERFMMDVIKIGMDFPNGYYINGKLKRVEQPSNDWIIRNYDYDKIQTKYKEIINELNIKL